MIARAQIRTLRNTSVRTDRDLRQVIDPRILAQPTVIQAWVPQEATLECLA